MTVNYWIDLMVSTEYNTEVTSGKGLLLREAAYSPCFRNDNNFLLTYIVIVIDNNTALLIAIKRERNNINLFQHKFF